MRSLSIASVITAALVAVAAISGSADAAPKKDKYLYLMGSTPQFAPIVVGIKKGFCKDLGLNVEMKMFTAGGVAAQSFLAGQGDWVNTGDWPAVRSWLNTQGNDDPVVGLHPSAHYTDLSVVVSKSSINSAAAGSKLMIRSTDSTASSRDLKCTTSSALFFGNSTMRIFASLVTASVPSLPVRMRARLNAPGWLE